MSQLSDFGYINYVVFSLENEGVVLMLETEGLKVEVDGKEILHGIDMKIL